MTADLTNLLREHASIAIEAKNAPHAGESVLTWLRTATPERVLELIALNETLAARIEELQTALIRGLELRRHAIVVDGTIERCVSIRELVSIAQGVMMQPTGRNAAAATQQVA